MSELSVAPTSPELPVDSGVVRTQKEFSDVLTMDLEDNEIKRAFEIMMPIKRKWEERFQLRFNDPLNFTVENAMELVDQFEEELKYELATKLDLYVTIDVTPLLEGEPMIIDFQGALESHKSAKYGYDHERKQHEVRDATKHGEDYLGQKEDRGKAKARSRKQKRMDQSGG